MNKNECRKILNKMCDLENIFSFNDLNKEEKEHIQNCPNCRNYISSIRSTINLYKNYDVTLPKDLKAKILKNVCCKLKGVS
jgi:hypothetical protein